MNIANDKLIMKSYESFLPKVKSWIDNLLLQYSSNVKCVADLGFSRLSQYFSKDILEAAKVVYIDHLPQIPLSSMGLDQFKDFEQMKIDGVTYYDIFFVRSPLQGLECLHFHELVHVVQWRYLKPDRFLLFYGLQLLKNKYANSLLETMAYQLQLKFQNSTNPFDVESVVKSELEKKVLPLFE
jgi:hypothetical protein